MLLRGDVVPGKCPPAVSLRSARNLNIIFNDNPAAGRVRYEPKHPGFFIEFVIANTSDDYSAVHFAPLVKTSFLLAVIKPTGYAFVLEHKLRYLPLMCPLGKLENE